MRTIAAAKCKAQFLGLLSEIESRRESVTVTKNGRPVAMVVPLPNPNASIADFYIGPGKTFEDITKPTVDADDYEVMR